MTIKASLEFLTSPHLDLLFFVLMLSLRAESLDWYLGQGRASL